jgi:hypothetical protein
MRQDTQGDGVGNYIVHRKLKPVNQYQITKYQAKTALVSNPPKATSPYT